MTAATDEIWGDVPGWIGIYQVSNLGRVKSLDRVVKSINPRTKRIEDRKYKGRILKQQTKSSGYRNVHFNHPDRPRICRHVHYLVALVFIGERPLDYEVCHNDGDPANNELTNLRYDTKEANIADRERHRREAA